MMKRWMAMGMALCLTAASLAGCSGTKDAAESTQAEAETSAEEAAAEEETAKESDLDKLTFTYVTSPLNVPTIIEKNQGIFEKTFGDMGIEVDYAELTSGADQTQALASGDVQVLYAVGGTSVILSAANGADIKVLNMYSRSPKAFCMYSKDESLTTPESLRGKTKAGLDGGSVDVALVAGATAYNAGQQGYHLVADGEGLIKAIIAVAVTQKFYDEHPEIIEKLEEAQTEIADFMEEKPDETMQIVADELDLDTDAVKSMYDLYDFSTEITDDDKEGFQKTADFMYESGMIDEAFDVKQLFIEK